MVVDTDVPEADRTPHVVIGNYPEDTRHIVGQDPARVLRRVKAHRKIMLEHTVATAWCVCVRCSDFDEGRLIHGRAVPGPCNTLRWLAEEFSDHPDYKSSYAPVQDNEDGT